MPVIGRFRLRRESRRAFFVSWFDALYAKDSPDCQVFCCSEILSAIFNRSPTRRADPNFLHGRQALHSNRAACDL